MKQPQLLLESNPPRAWLETVERAVDNFNIAATGVCDYYPLAYLLRGRDGSVLGGIHGNVWGGWLHVRSLWLAGHLRRRGYGTRLLARAEGYARAKGAIGAFLSTASYEARPFYERFGYRVYGALDNHPIRGYTRYFMSRLFVGSNEQLVEDWSLRLEPYPPREALDALRRGIAEHAAAALGPAERIIRPCYLFLRDETGEIIGGLLGNTWGRWLFISHLWVDGLLRRRGMATSLMTAAETEAQRRGCGAAFLDSFSFNPYQLYERLGYRNFGELRNHPLGHDHYFMAKRLTD